MNLTELKSITIEADAAAATAEPTFEASYRDMIIGRPEVIYGAQQGLLTGDTPVIAVPAPSSEIQAREITSITVYNADTQTRTITVKKIVGGVGIVLCSVALPPGKLMTYSAGIWKIDDGIATAADRVQTGLDVVATAADRVQTGLDVVATAADRVQTGLDVVATAADRVAVENIESMIMSLDEANRFVGVAYNIETDEWFRLGAGRDVAVGQFVGASYSPVLSRLRRVALADNGTVYKGIDWLDFTRHTDNTAVALDGTNGQIMVEYLPGYIKTGILGDWYYLLISHLALDGFALHPLFADGVLAAYHGAYEASVYDGKLCSIAKDPADGVSDVYPVTTRAGAWGHGSLTAAATDTLAAARGAGWQQADFTLKHWERCLMLVGYASFDIPGIVGAGRINLSGGDWTNGSYIGKCGLGDASSGYASAVQAGTTGGYATDYAQVLGIENPWGNIWERVASLVSDHAVYYKPLPPYDYTTIAGWTRLLDAAGLGITLPTSNGYAGVPQSGLGLVLPKDVTGSSSTMMADYFYQAAGLRVFLVGGGADSGANAGPFYWSATDAASYAHANIGGRLCFKKT